LLYPRNETGADSEQNVAREDDEKMERERLAHYHTMHTIPFPIPIPITPPRCRMQTKGMKMENS
jgi:hypothetical protein